MISVLVPSRGNPDDLQRSVESLRGLADRPGEIEVWVGADRDDPDTAAMAGYIGCDVELFDRQGYRGLHVYYQRLAELASGDWLLVWNDDAVMLTPGWDAVLSRLPAGALVADLQSHHSPMVCFPAVRREAMAMLGGRFCTANPHVDSFWQDAGRATGTIFPVAVHIRHDQRVGHEDWGSQHGYYEPAHQAELAGYVRRLRSALAERAA